MDYIFEYNRWLQKAHDDLDLINELKAMSDEEKNDAFYRHLEFGTGGLRGVIGAGTNRINYYTVARATQGLANYINSTFEPHERKVAISRDSRIKSDLFANIAAQVFAANGIKVYIYPYISPVPTLSFATRFLHCCSGVMITASHNPSKYNGYKVYGSDGCQITTEAAKTILSFINEIDCFDGYKIISLDDGFDSGMIEYIKPGVITKYIEEVKKQSLIKNEKVDKNFDIVYSPLNGTGLYPIRRTLSELGYTNIKIVEEQENPDGHFPTCPFPNPEIKEALDLGLKYCKKYNADLMLATDPDCDRVGIAVRSKSGEYVLLSGNELGIVLLDYVCSRRIALNTMPKNPVMVKTIVTMDLAERIANDYGVKAINVLTGFKFIGEQIGLMEKEGRKDDYIFGLEESYGFLSGTYVRDKDAVNASVLICEMFAYYKTRGISILDKLNQLWEKYGYYLNTLRFYEFNGPTGQEKMAKIMNQLRDNITTMCGLKIIEKQDYLPGLNGLPQSNVLKFMLEKNCSIVLRPSGTEPKLKIYISVNATSQKEAEVIEEKMAKIFEDAYLKNI